MNEQEALAYRGAAQALLEQLTAVAKEIQRAEPNLSQAQAFARAIFADLSDMSLELAESLLDFDDGPTGVPAELTRLLVERSARALRQRLDFAWVGSSLVDEEDDVWLFARPDGYFDLPRQGLAGLRVETAADVLAAQLDRLTFAQHGRLLAWRGSVRDPAAEQLLSFVLNQEVLP